LRDKINLAAFFKLAYGGHNDNAINRIREVLYGLNLEWVEKSKGYVHEAKLNIEKEIRLNTLIFKQHEITETNPLVQRYFTRIADKSKDGGEIGVALNGFVKG
jgi:hypothetical protein